MGDEREEGMREIIDLFCGLTEADAWATVIEREEREATPVTSGDED